MMFRNDYRKEVCCDCFTCKFNSKNKIWAKKFIETEGTDNRIKGYGACRCKSKKLIIEDHEEFGLHCRNYESGIPNIYEKEK